MTMQLARDETNMPCEQSLLGLWMRAWPASYLAICTQYEALGFISLAQLVPRASTTTLI